MGRHRGMDGLAGARGMRGRGAGRRSAVLWSACALASLASPGWTQEGPYALQRGDVLRVLVMGTGIEEEVAVDIDGEVSVPVAGTLPAAGRTLRAVRSDIAAAFDGASVPHVRSDGIVAAIQVAPSAVSVTIAEHRPIYVDGDVAAPGAYAFTPGLTAGQAITLAGGYGLGGSEAAEVPPLARADLRGTLRRLEVERATIEADLRRLADELAVAEARAAEPGSTFEGGATDPAGAPSGSEDLDGARMEAFVEEVARDERFLSEGRAFADRRLSMLQEQYDRQAEGAEAEAEAYETMRRLREAGNVTANRLDDARRSMLYATIRQMETSAEIARVERDATELVHRMEDETTERVRDALDDIAERTERLRLVEADLATAREKLVAAGASPERIAERVSVSVERTDAQGVGTVLTGASTVLRPGDTVRATVELDAS